jgi:hypothetical protein
MAFGIAHVKIAEPHGGESQRSDALIEGAVRAYHDVDRRLGYIELDVVEDALPRVAGAHSIKFNGVHRYRPAYYGAASHLCVFLCGEEGQPATSGDNLAESPMAPMLTKLRKVYAITQMSFYALLVYIVAFMISIPNVRRTYCRLWSSGEYEGG